MRATSVVHQHIELRRELLEPGNTGVYVGCAGDIQFMKMHRGRAGFLALGGYCLQTINPARADHQMGAFPRKMHRALRAKPGRSARDENPLVLERSIHAWTCCTCCAELGKCLFTIPRSSNPSAKIED